MLRDTPALPAPQQKLHGCSLRACRSPSPNKEREKHARSEPGAGHAAHSDLTPKLRLEAEADRMLLTQQLLDRVGAAACPDMHAWD